MGQQGTYTQNKSWHTGATTSKGLCWDKGARTSRDLNKHLLLRYGLEHAAGDTQQYRHNNQHIRTYGLLLLKQPPHTYQ